MRLFPKILLLILGLLILLAVVLTVVEVRDETRQISSLVEQKGTQVARVLSVSALPHLVNRDFGTLNALLQETQRGSDLIAGALLGPDGVILAHTDIDRLGDKGSDDLFLQAAAGKVAVVQHRGRGNEAVMAVGAPVRLRGDTLGVLRLEFSEAAVYQSLRSTVLRGIGVAAVAVVVGSLLAFAASGLITRPIRQLTASAGRISRGDMSHPIVVNRGDEIGELAAAFQTMTESLKRTFGDLVREKRRTEAIVQSVPDGMVAVDAGRRVTFMNPAALSVLGFSADEVLGRPCVEILGNPPCVADCFLAGGSGAPSARREEMGLITKTGRPIRVIKTVAPLQDEDGRVAGAVETIRDITQTRRLEEKVRQSERLASVGKLAAGVAHEINNPLSAVIGISGVLLRRLPADHADRGPLQEISDYGKRCARIVRDLLNYARQMPPEKRSTDMNRLVRESVQRIERANPDKRFSVTFDLDPLLPEVLADPYQMEQVFSNIVLNAVQSLNGEGEVRIVSDLNGDHIRISVIDNGCGIPPENRSRVFEPFFTTKPQGTGTGLGLSISYGIVSGHGGTIDVESEEGIGTCFTVHLPLSPISRGPI